MNDYAWQINLGEKYKISALYIDSILVSNEHLISKNKYLLTNWIKNKTSKGYPFARLTIDTLIFNSNSINLYYQSYLGKMVYNGDLTSTSVIKNNVLLRLCHWKKGNKFNLDVISKINAQLSQIPYVELKSFPGITFSEDSAHLNLNIARKKINQFNALIGFEPNPATNKLEVTADINLKLFNVFKRLDEWELTWSTPEKSTQDFAASTTLPLLFNSPFGYHFQIALFKQDSSSVTSAITNGLVFTPNFNSKVILYVAKESFNPIDKLNENLFREKKDLLGVRANLNKLNNIFNPSKGIDVEVNFSQGAYRSFAASNTDKQQLFQGMFQTNVYTPIIKSFILKQKLHLAHQVKDGSFSNFEMFEIGGFSSFRGVNENFIRTNSFFTHSFSPRYLLETNSYLEIFIDNLWFSSNNNNTYQHYWSIGSGFAFSVKGGIFNMSLGISDIGNGLVIKNSKIHFGYVNLF